MSNVLFFILLILSQSAFAKMNCKISADENYEISTQQIRQDDLNADFLYPKGCAFKKIIVVFGGSEGGINTRFAKRFAKLGYGVYTLGYFNVDGSKLPKHLIQVPIEYFTIAIEKISNLNFHTDCCYLAGGSKGAEAILTTLSLTGIKYKRAILISGADRVMEGLGERNHPAKKSSWLFQNKDVPFTPLEGLSFMEFLKLAWNLFKVPPRLREMYLRSIENDTDGNKGLLPIKNVNTQILFLSGEDDHLWPSTIMGKNLEAEFEREGKALLFKHISYPGAGHAILGGHIALEEEANKTFLGGNIKDSKVADKRAFEEIISFLEDKL